MTAEPRDEQAKLEKSASNTAKGADQALQPKYLDALAEECAADGLHEFMLTAERPHATLREQLRQPFPLSLHHHRERADMAELHQSG
jgi:hypothetical protein